MRCHVRMVASGTDRVGGHKFALLLRGWEVESMGVAVERPVEREYRSWVSDNRRWARFVSRQGDIFVCTAPKCGTTWMQTIVAALLFPAGDAPGRVMEIAPWFDA